MDAGAWDVLDPVLDDLLALRPEQRAAALAARTDLTAGQRAYVEQVLAEAAPDGARSGLRSLEERPIWQHLNETLESDEVRDSLAPGERFAQYEVVELIGRGGMGEVYRARDTRLGRDVALKVLPDDLAGHPERVARFEREARLLAAINHPNIAALYEVAEAEGRQALVLEYVEGETLGSLTARGPMRLPEVLSTARQIVLALSAAHQRGIIHRDLKPANIKLTRDGTVKVLDFGLARHTPGQAQDAAATESLTSQWKPGAVMGTPIYMSPEQALGQPASERADVWAFGCVLYEMLTGVRAFEGESAAQIVARVLERDPDFSKLPPRTPEALVRLLRKSLAKDPLQRLADISTALPDLEAAANVGDRRTRRIRQALAVTAGLSVVGLAAAVAIVGLPRSWTTHTPRAAVRLAVPIPASDALIVGVQQVAALSPDDRTLVYRAVRQGTVFLFERSLDSLVSRPIAGTENASGPFFSPDGRWIGFDGDGVLRKVPVAGGSPVTICAAPGGATASWAGHTIVFSTATNRVLQRVAAAGGTPERITALDTTRGDLAHAFPEVLPRGEAALFTIISSGRRQLAAVRFDTREITILLEGSQPRYHPSGHLLFVRNDAIWAVRFNERQLTLASDPTMVVDGLDSGGGAVHYAVNARGTLMYVPRREEARTRQLVWVDRSGVEIPLAFEPKRYQRAALSPDGRRIVTAFAEDTNTDIWVAPVDQTSWIRLTRDPTTETSPLWAPDGRSVVFRSDREGGGLFSVSADRPGEVSRLTSSDSTLHTPHGWSADGKTLLFTEFRSYVDQSIASTPAGTRRVERLFGGGHAVLRPQASPDGRWLAYQSDESGSFEIYVRPAASPNSGMWKVSTAGGTSPRWAQDGRELLYFDGSAIVSVPIRPGPSFQAGTPSRLFRYAPFGGRLGPDYDVTPDGQRFLMIRSTDDSPGTRAQLVVVQRWVDELESRGR